MKNERVLILMVLLFFSASLVADQDHQYVAFPDWPYFSEVVVAGETIYVSGMMGVDKDNHFLLAPGGIGPQTRQTLDNVKSALAKVDASMDDVVKCTVYLTDMADWVSMNEVWLEFFAEDRVPARAAVGVQDLGGHGKVEISCIAVRSARQ